MNIDGIDIIYWINLDSSTERRENMEKILSDDCFANNEIKRFSAIDGKIPNLVDKLINTDKKEITDSEYGCLLSHLEVIRNVANGDKNIALILEDDLTLDFQKYWKKNLKEIIDNAPKDWEIIMLSYICNNVPPDEYTLNKNNYWSTLAYVINKPGAQRLIHNIYKNDKYNVESTINNEADQYIFQKLITYTYRYPLFIYKYDEESTLHQGAIERHNNSRRKIEDMYENNPNIMEGFCNITAPLFTYFTNIINYMYIFIFLLLTLVVYYLSKQFRTYKAKLPLISNIRKYWHSI